MLATIRSRTFVFLSAVEKRKNRIYMTIILSMALYGRETWYLTLREGHRLRVCENRVLGRSLDHENAYT
jgi:hypothetical protein